MPRSAPRRRPAREHTSRCRELTCAGRRGRGTERDQGDRVTTAAPPPRRAGLKHASLYADTAIADLSRPPSSRLPQSTPSSQPIPQQQTNRKGFTLIELLIV